MAIPSDFNKRVSKGSLGEVEKVTRRGTASEGSLPPGEVERVSNQGAEPPDRPRSASGHGTIRGTVLTCRDEPLCEATVAISGGPMHKDIAALTNEQGQFLLSDLLPGEYRVTAHAGGHAPETKHIAVTANEVSTVQFALEP
jgi:hypothetical protein